MNARNWLAALGAAACMTPAALIAQEAPVKIGLILPMTGPFASTGRQIEAAVNLFVKQNGASVAGRRVEIILKDDGGTADATRRLTQELIANDKVAIVAGFGLTPSAMAVAPLISQSKTPAVIMAAATSSIVASSPYFVRTSYTLPQTSATMADWALKNGIRKTVTLVSDYGPGIDAETSFKQRFVAGGGTITAEIRVPLRSPDFAPFLQRVRDASPDALFVFVPSGPGTALMNQFKERGLGQAGIKLIGDGGITDDDFLGSMSDSALNIVTAFHYSAAHDSTVNKQFVSAFQSANKGMRPNFMAVGGYDGMRVIYNALEKTKGDTKGDVLIAAMRGQSFESPRGPINVDAQTRDIVQNIYIRRVERRGNELYNIELDTFRAVKDQGK